MPRLIDDLLTAKSITLLTGERLPVPMKNEFRNLIHVEADSVSAMYWQDPDDEFDEFKDFGCLRMPFPELWIEWRMPRRIHADGRWLLNTTHDAGGCVLFNADGDSCRELVAQATPSPGGAGISPDVSHIIGVLPLNKAGGELFSFQMYEFIGTDESGAYQGCTWMISDESAYGRELIRNVRTGSDIYNPLPSQTRPALLALSMMNCKNVQLHEVVPPAALSRKFQKKTGRPLLRYSRIVLPRITGTYGQKRAAVGGPKALHLVRGHFKTYTDEAPLFGKKTGTFWWNWQARGDRSQGVVVPRYEVTATDR